MDCGRWRDAISARADGEDPGVAEATLDAHLAACPECRAFHRDLAAMTPPFRLQVPPPMPDLSRRVVKRNALLDRASRWGMVRGLLGVVAVEIAVLALPSLVLGDDQGAAAHTARHLGAFSLAYAVGLLVVVARPARARTMLPVAAVLAAALLITAVADVLDGVIPLVNETGHLPEILSVPLLWLLASPGPVDGSVRRRRWRRAVGPSGSAAGSDGFGPSTRPLHLVGPEAGDGSSGAAGGSAR
jgi:predicted anti-sigma-YlaC factor YlaD